MAVFPGDEKLTRSFEENDYDTALNLLWKNARAESHDKIPSLRSIEIFELIICLSSLGNKKNSA